MIFKVSLFLASLPVASATLRGENSEHAEAAKTRKLMGADSINGSGMSLNMGGVPLTSVRSINGAENPLAEPDAELQRLILPAHYPDGAGEGTSFFMEPNPRSISNAVSTMPEGIGSNPVVTDSFWQWGQFMDHDVGLTEGMASTPIDEADEDIGVGVGSVPILSEDCNADPDGICTIPFERAVSHFTNGIREQLNEITAFLDANTVYGASEERSNLLREFQNGRMLMSEGDVFLPDIGVPGGSPFTDGVAAGPFGTGGINFLGGDVRPMEQPGLLSIHTMWVREHNRIAAILQEQYPDETSDENLFQMARKVVNAEIQHITYTEFLPLLIGSLAPDPNAYAFDPNVNPGVAQEFAGCAYRVGHTFISGDLILHNGVNPTGSVNLVNEFFRPQLFVDFPGTIDEILIGQSFNPANLADPFVIDEVRSDLFGAPIAGEGRDLVVFNIARARDHGINTYTAIREGLGLSVPTDFSGVSSDSEIQSRLAAAYPGGVSTCDCWICGLAEPAVNGGQVGEFFSTIIADQFTRYRDGDPFFYTGDPDLVTLVEETTGRIDVFTTTLADVINANTVGGAIHPAMQVDKSR